MLICASNFHNLMDDQLIMAVARTDQNQPKRRVSIEQLQIKVRRERVRERESEIASERIRLCLISSSWAKDINIIH